MSKITLERVTEADTELVALWNEAISDSGSMRGIEALRTSAGEGIAPDELLPLLVSRGRVWAATHEGRVKSFVILHERVIQALYVAVAHRRQGIARLVLGALGTTSTPPIDAWALPGDRATKSLYESMGWKARLLTMRAE
ncbi:MAG TPA: hypothetical protein VMV53_04735 [Acidimicrobiales bacterium]|nr:hypothetical protein [Acidimicrobiales bacterium]